MRLCRRGATHKLTRWGVSRNRPPLATSSAGEPQVDVPTPHGALAYAAELFEHVTSFGAERSPERVRLSLFENGTQAQATKRAEARSASLPPLRSVPDLPDELEEQRLPGALFGYDKYTVTKLLDNLRESFSDLALAAAERDQRIQHLSLELHQNLEDQRLIAETLLEAQQHARSIREEARRNATALLKRARKQAEKLQDEIERRARARSDELIASAEQQRARLIASGEHQHTQLIETAEQERAKLLAQAGEARAFVDQTHEQLSDFLMAAVRWYEKAKLSDDNGRGGEAPTVSEERPLNERT